jgi:transposase-like protein
VINLYLSQNSQSRDRIKILSGKSVPELKKENSISSLLNKWKKQYIKGNLNNHNNQEVKKLQLQVENLNR